MRTRRVLLGIAAVLIFVSGRFSYQAQESSVPRVIEYEGDLGKTGLGQTVSGVQSVTFALYPDKEGGAPLWLETQNVTGDAAGHFNAKLGSAGVGFPVDLLASGQARWLGVSVNGTGNGEQARVQLVSVPYALRALDAETLAGRPVTDFALANAKGSSPASFGITSGNPDTPVVLAIAGTGTTNKISKWTDNAGTLGDSAMTESGGNIGLGIGAPQHQLDIVGPNARARVYSTGSEALFRFRADGQTSGKRGWDMITRADVFKFRTVSDDEQNVTRDNVFVIQGSGSVGIGVDPLTPLQVKTTNANANQSFMVSGPQNLADGVSFYSADDANQNLKGMELRGLNLSQTGLGGIRFRTGGGDLLRGIFDSTGNFGVGTATPSERLHVVGNFLGTGNVSGSVLVSTVATGTPPLTVASTTAVPNLNASLLGGLPAASFGDITGVSAGAGLTGGATSGNATLNVSTAALTRGITYLAGCDTCSVLADADDQKTIFLNVVGTMTIQSVTCFADAGTPSVNIQKDDGSPANVLASDLACSVAGTTTSSFSGAEATVNLNDKLDFAMVSAGGVAKRVTLAIKALVN